jgi:hypothetical protein
MSVGCVDYGLDLTRIRSPREKRVFEPLSVTLKRGQSLILLLENKPGGSAATSGHHARTC